MHYFILCFSTRYCRLLFLPRPFWPTSTSFPSPTNNNRRDVLHYFPPLFDISPILLQRNVQAIGHRLGKFPYLRDFFDDHPYLLPLQILLTLSVYLNCRLRTCASMTANKNVFLRRCAAWKSKFRPWFAILVFLYIGDSLPVFSDIRRRRILFFGRRTIQQLIGCFNLTTVFVHEYRLRYISDLLLCSVA